MHVVVDIVCACSSGIIYVEIAISGVTEYIISTMIIDYHIPTTDMPVDSTPSLFSVWSVVHLPCVVVPNIVLW